MTEENDKLVPTTIGSSLIDAAKRKRQKQVTDGITSYVATLMESIEKAKHIIECNQNYITRAEKRLEAIATGQFEFDNLWNIKFKDESLHNEAD